MGSSLFSEISSIWKISGTSSFFPFAGMCQSVFRRSPQLCPCNCSNLEACLVSSRHQVYLYSGIHFFSSGTQRGCAWVFVLSLQQPRNPLRTAHFGKHRVQLVYLLLLIYFCPSLPELSCLLLH